ncbi:MAG: DUF4832 domain-containing protein [Lachnospiraceae bacterium]|nr:DUF4832 domain-containing protein [Lachnospiraceae bacterium]
MKKCLWFTRLRRMIPVALLGLLVMSGFSAQVAASVVAFQEQNLDYSDSLETLTNPERGFYEAYCIHLKPEGTSPIDPKNNLVHLRVDLSAFSDNALLDEKNQVYGESMPLTADALQVLGQILENIKGRGHSAIIRTCYDPLYNGKSNYEPDQDTIIGHLRQLGALYTQYKDVISYVELGTYGPWGEMHTSKCCTTENVSAALNALLAVTPEDIKIGVRTPNYVAAWLGIKNNNTEFDVESDVFKQAVAAKGSSAYRVGMFNDGYLGSGTDLGTYGSISRANGVAWLGMFADYTLYGGEVVADATGSGSYIGPYNSIEYISDEGFKTHTSYLNIAWNNNVIASWKDLVYSKAGDEYDGQTGFKYVDDHLGYRLVLRNSKLADAAPGGNLSLALQIENVGFAKVVNSKKASIILKNETGQIYEIACPGINPSGIVSGQNNNLSAAVSLPDDLALGAWNVYLRFSKYGDYTTDNNYQCIRFANTAQYWDEILGANYIGTVNIVEQLPQTPPVGDGQGDNSQSSGGQGNNNQSGTITQGKDNKPGVAATAKKPAKAKILSLKNKKGRKIYIKIKKQSGVTGYQIAYGTKKSIKKAKKKFTKKRTVTLKKLKKKRTYYVTVRAYRKVKGKKVCGKWSKWKRIKVRK